MCLTNTLNQNIILPFQKSIARHIILIPSWYVLFFYTPQCGVLSGNAANTNLMSGVQTHRFDHRIIEAFFKCRLFGDILLHILISSSLLFFSLTLNSTHWPNIIDIIPLRPFLNGVWFDSILATWQPSGLFIVLAFSCRCHFQRKLSKWHCFESPHHECLLYLSINI